MRKYLLTFLTLIIILSGCSGLETNEVEVLEIAAENDEIVIGQTMEITAVGKDEDGNPVSVSPEWKIVEGSGTLGSIEGSKVKFYAEHLDPSGYVTIQAFHGDIEAEVKIKLKPALGNELDDLFPPPDSIIGDLVEKTDSVTVSIGEKVDNYHVKYPAKWISNGQSVNAPVVFVKDGVRLDDYQSNNYPHVPEEWIDKYAPGGQGDDIYDMNYLLREPIPYCPQIIHKKYYILVQQGTLTAGDSFSTEKDITVGTTATDTIEFARTTSKEITASSSWGWGSASASLSETVSEKTSSSVSVTQEETQRKRFTFNNTEDSQVIFGIWQRVDWYYLGDRNGDPIDESELFPNYGVVDEQHPRREIRIRRDERVIRSYTEDDLN